MKANFEKSLRWLVQLEGVEVTNVLGDHGGLTGYSGITDTEFQAYLLRHGLPSRPIETMTPMEAADILLENYWEPGHCDDLPDGLDFVHFAWFVNHGTGANRHLQATAEAWEADGHEDGVVGPNTLAMVQRWVESGPYGTTVLIERYLAIQTAKYDEIEQSNQTQLKFLKGWKNRITRTRQLIMGIPLTV